MDKKLEKALKKSGNNLHLKVFDILENHDWEVDMNSYYYDDTATKPREIDLIASRNITDKKTVYLFIECKYFTEEIAFRLIPNKTQQTKEALILRNINRETYLDICRLRKYQHHYMAKDYIAKLYDTDKANDNSVFNAITQPIKSLCFAKDGISTSKKIIYYPMVIYDGIDGIHSIYEDRKADDITTAEKYTKHIYGINYTYKHHYNDKVSTQYFCIDFVHINEAKKFFKGIITESEKIIGRDEM